MPWTPPGFVPDSSAAPAPAPAAFPRHRPIPGAGFLGGLMVPAGGIAGGLGGAALGTMAGGPIGGYLGGVAGATAGGAAMEGAREALSGQPLNPSQIGHQGMGQGVSEAIGVPLGNLVGRAASGLMRSALKPGKVVQQQAMRALSIKVGRKVTPNEASLAEQALKEGVGVTQGGLRKVRSEAAAAAGRLDDIFSNANATGKTFNVNDALAHLGRLRSKLRMQSDASEALSTLRGQVNSFIKSKSTRPIPASSVLGVSGAPARAAQTGTPIEVPPSVFNEWKRTWQKASEAIYSAEAKGATVGPRQAVKARLNQNIAATARRTLEQFPGVAKENQRMAALHPLEQAILEALYRNTGQTVGAIPPAISWAVPGFIRSPENISRLALLMNGPTVRGGLRYGPHVVAPQIFNSGTMPDSVRTNGR